MMAVHPDVLEVLRCPVCGQLVEDVPSGLRCARGHSFDRARQGYVSLLHGVPASAGDSAEMVAARAGWLAAGHFRPLVRALVEEAREACASSGIVVDAGGGTGFYLAAVMDALPGRGGLSMDVSKYAARRAAKAHPRIDAVVTDTMAHLPLRDRGVALLLDIFAPRNAVEFHRVLSAEGALLMVTPGPDHLVELRTALGLLAVDPDKDARVARTMEPCFACASSTALGFEMLLSHDEARQLVAMGPSAWHRSGDELAAGIAQLPATIAVRAEFRVQRWRPLPTD